MKISLSEKSGLPNTIRILIGGGLMVASGALFQHGDVVWGFLALGLAVFLLGMSVSHNLLDNNYLIGFDAGYKEGSLAIGLVAPESDLREGNYRVLGSIADGNGWAVMIKDLESDQRPPRVYRLGTVPPVLFRKIRLNDPESKNMDSFIPGYEPISRPA